MNEKLISQFYERLGMKIDFEIIDNLIMSDNNILRPVVGHAFEYLIEDVVKNKLNGQIIEEGGDTDVDLIIVDNNGVSHKTQVKTLKSDGIRHNISFQINLHKTHGIETRPNNLYPIIWPCPKCPHAGEEFPEFLILPHPTDGVLIVPKQNIPESKTYPGHFADPATFLWKSEWLNRWDLLGFPEFRGVQLERKSVPVQPILNNVCQRVNLTYEELLKIWLKPSNFKMIDMNLKGNLREPAMKFFLESQKCKTKQPTEAYPKYDIWCNNFRIQIKGASKAKTNPETNKLGVETMGSHGNGEVRRYSTTDFDYLGIVIEPYYLNSKLNIDHDKYHFCFIPVEDLPLHYRNGYEWKSSDKLYDVASFNVVSSNKKVYLVPSNSYSKPPKFITENGKIIIREPVSFRNNKIYELDKIPEKMKK